MKLKNEVGTEEVNEAHYLFEQSTMKSLEGREFGLMLGDDMGGEVQRIEEAIRKRVCIGTQVTFSKLTSEMQERYNANGVLYAISNMIRNGEFREIKLKKTLIREK